MFHLTAYKAEVEKADTSVATVAPADLAFVLGDYRKTGRKKGQTIESGDQV